MEAASSARPSAPVFQIDLPPKAAFRLAGITLRRLGAGGRGNRGRDPHERTDAEKAALASSSVPSKLLAGRCHHDEAVRGA